MRKELIELLNGNIQDLLLDDSKWESLLINKYPPVIHRLFCRISEDRTVMLHRLFHSGNEECLMHSHSWPFAIKIIEGGYDMGIGFSKERNIIPETICKMRISKGGIYEMTSSDIWHYTKPLENKESYSIMLVGNRWRERKAENNLPITEEDKIYLLNYFRDKLSHTNK